MSAPFSRTLQTAEDADGVARLLTRAAARVTGLHPDRARLEALAERYTDYAAALRETATDARVEPADPEQAALL